MNLRLSLALIRFVSILGLKQDALGQCGTASVAVTDYCPDQYAEFNVTNPSVSSNYHWFDIINGGNDTLDYNYTENFVSVGTIAGGSGPVDYYYREEYDASAGPAYTSQLTAVATGNEPYYYDFDATESFRLNFVTVPIQSWSPADDHYIQIQVGLQYSNIYVFKPGNHTLLSSQIYLVRI